MKTIEKHYTIEYKDKSSDHVIIANNGKESHLLSDGFDSYETRFRSHNSIKEVEEYLKNGKFVKKLKLEKTISLSKHKFNKSAKLINVIEHEFPKKSGDWFSR